MNQGLLTETHLLKIAGVLIDSYFSPWLTPEQAVLELAEKAVRGKKKNGEKWRHLNGEIQLKL